MDHEDSRLRPLWARLGAALLAVGFLGFVVLRGSGCSRPTEVSAEPTSAPAPAATPSESAPTKVDPPGSSEEEEPPEFFPATKAGPVHFGTKKSAPAAQQNAAPRKTSAP